MHNWIGIIERWGFALLAFVALLVFSKEKGFVEALAGLSGFAAAIAAWLAYLATRENAKYRHYDKKVEFLSCLRKLTEDYKKYSCNSLLNNEEKRSQVQVITESASKVDEVARFTKTGTSQLVGKLMADISEVMERIRSCHAMNRAILVMEDKGVTQTMTPYLDSEKNKIETEYARKYRQLVSLLQNVEACDLKDI